MQYIIILKLGTRDILQNHYIFLSCADLNFKPQTLYKNSTKKNYLFFIDLSQYLEF